MDGLPFWSQVSWLEAAMCNHQFSESEWPKLPPLSLPKNSASLPVFEIVFAASIALYHEHCAALSCNATPGVAM